MALLYLLHQPVAVDSPDAQGHTSLMWAAYQGDALSVDILLKHGASVSIKDQVGLTPLHWAVVRGNKFCIRKLVEAGADLNAKDENGKTPKEMAIELKSLGAYKKALEEGGLNEDGVLIPRQFSERNTKIAIFLIPTLFFYLIFTTLSILPWYTGIVLAMAEFFGMHHIVSRVLLNHSAYTEQVAQSPYFAGIINASLVWVAWAWFSRLVRNTPGFAFTNLAFTLTFLLCAYNFFRSITLDPGSCPKPANDAELKSTIEDLASEGRLNGQSFCVECMARKALRSKHCKVCGKCTARFDHHCPWIWNCVGVNNHRQFVIFVTTLVIGISLFDYLTYQYFAMLPIPPPTEDPSSDSCLFPASLCSLTSHDTFLFSVALWSTLQLTWTLLLLIGQLWQITRQMTTFEVSNLGRYGFMGGRSGTSLAQQQGHQHQHHHGPSLDGVSDMDASSVNGSGHGGHKHRHGACGTGFLLKLLGLDRYTSKNAASGLTKASRASNPFDAGLISNCIDFWTRGRELGVEYERLYVVPGEGFKEAKRRNEREHLDDGPGHGGGKRRGMLMGWGARLRGNNSGGGYLPLRTEEQV
ncbi:zf-DHHC-domain-containing protein [Sistotremastrum niveocremeum HHB9708]|uniref:Palmitoyltransferase n=1 Tax=Sistotremastrum niveocremeum HHB9708 TaxID=1314777 RepID=A0A164QBU2_9AGAM|nr:zf-DHHC-domain-containing protein [Sistotremastrum niveocremeum HHB9708]